MCYSLENFCNPLRIDNEELPHVLELGCGTGLCGFAAAQVGCKVTSTDRNSDLVALNIEHTMVGARDMTSYDLSWEASRTAEGTQTQGDTLTIADIVHKRGKVDVVIGAEITCLRKQQPILVDTIVQLIHHSPEAIVLLSFDDVPPPNGCNYEAEMLKHMRERGFRHEVVCVADIDWTIVSTYSTGSSATAPGQPEGSETMLLRKVSTATLRDRTPEFVDVNNPLVLPFLGGAAASTVTLEEKAPSANTPPPPPHNSSSSSGLASSAENNAAVREKTTTERTTHHITLFYRPTAVSVCSRCQREYFRHPTLTPVTRCVYHGSYYVCRFHPAEVRCSINGQGDGLGYYGNGREGYPAKFWDCCGEEGFDARGCCEGVHMQY